MRYPLSEKHIKENFSFNNCEFKPNILVFLPSIKEIKEVIKFIEEDTEKAFKTANQELGLNLEELHGGLKPREKQKVFEPEDDLKHKVRIILSTKIAETAITLEDVFYVLDSGLETQYYFDETTKMDYKKQETISKSSAIQRQGRAGRIANGYCFKMYKGEDEELFADTAKPEILRMDIADVIMTQIELQDMYKMSDLLFYDRLLPAEKPNKIQEVAQELTKLMATETNKINMQTVLTNKGKFMIRANLNGLTGAFLYECIRLGAEDLGVIAATALNSIKGVFKNNVSVLHQRTRSKSSLI